MMIVIVALLGFLIVFAISVFLFLLKQKHDLEQKLQEATIKSSQDFMGKMEFFFNRFNQAKDESSKQTLSVVDPIGKTLEKLQRQIDEFEKIRISRDGNLHNNIKSLMDLQNDVKKETNKLINVFKKPNTRGKWGEVQLQRIAEISGMLPFCEFQTQNTDIDGIRPDMTVNLPNGGCIFIDAKTPLDAYMKILEDTDDEESVKKENLKAIKNHIYLLSNKKYWNKTKSPDFVVMFIPLEHTWLSAVEEDPKLMEYATEKNVIVATPMTLIGLLKTVFLGWSQVKFAEEADNLKKSLKIIEEYIKSVIKGMDDIRKNSASITNRVLGTIGTMELIKSETEKYQDMSSILQPTVLMNDEITINNQKSDETIVANSIDVTEEITSETKISKAYIKDILDRLNNNKDKNNDIEEISIIV
jgi:DNA recombination protein RmuC